MNTFKAFPYISDRLNAAMDSTKPFTKERNKALKSVKWALRSGSMYVKKFTDLAKGPELTTDIKEALLFDGRDNELTKARVYSALFNAPFTPELI